MATSSAFASSSSPTRACSTARPRAAPGLSRRSATSSRSDAPTTSPVVFGRRITSRTPGRFSYARDQPRQRAGDPGPLPRLQGQAVPQGGPALRTETTVNDTYDFGIGRLLTEANWDALLRVGHDINERLLDAQLQACACAPDAAALERIVLPSRHDGHAAAGLRFGDPRVMALLASLCAFSHLLEGLTNRCLRDASPN
jgi:hypothetical protein